MRHQKAPHSKRTPSQARVEGLRSQCEFLLVVNTKNNINFAPVRDVAQLVSVLGLGPRGPPFESEYPDKKMTDVESVIFLS